MVTLKQFIFIFLKLNTFIYIRNAKNVNIYIYYSHISYLTYIINEVECKPYTLPYRNPTDTEIENNTPIKISDTPIPDVDTAVEESNRI